MYILIRIERARRIILSEHAFPSYSPLSASPVRHSVHYGLNCGYESITNGVGDGARYRAYVLTM